MYCLSSFHYEHVFFLLFNFANTVEENEVIVCFSLYILRDKALVAVLVFVQINKNLFIIPHLHTTNNMLAKQAVCVLPTYLMYVYKYIRTLQILS